MKNRFKEFLGLHHAEDPLLIGNVWDVQSTKIFEGLKFKAVATSSAAVAETLGFEDGENMPFSDYFFVIEHICRYTTVPLSVDLESGYGGDASEVVEQIVRLAEIGVSGINLEDSLVKGGQRQIVPQETFSENLSAIHMELQSRKCEIFINVRSDVFLLGLADAAEDAINRLKSYQQTGIHGLFFPCITRIEDIRAVTSAAKLPVNVMCMPGLPSFNILGDLGVRRISMGNFLNKNVYGHLESTVEQILARQKFDLLFT